jgi:hypothetical protein
MRNRKDNKKDKRLSQVLFLLLLGSCFLFFISSVACGRRGDPVLIEHYSDIVDERDLDDNAKNAVEPGDIPTKEHDADKEEIKASAPDTPTGLVGVYTLKSIVLTWNEMTGRNVRFYNVYRSSGDKFIFAGETVTPAFTDNNIDKNVQYYYKVTAVGELEGLPSDEIMIKTGMR